MHVVVDLPDPKSGLDAALAKQFADLQRQLMGLVKDQSESKASMQSMMLDCMKEQQSSLMDAMERLLGMVQKTSSPSDALVSAVRGLKQVVADLPGDLQGALDKQFQSVQERTMKVSVKPNITVEMPKGLVNRLDSLETSLLNGLRRSRSRTFASNY